jgi:hypothetical protein
MPQTTELKSMAISEIIEKYPQTLAIFQTYGLQVYATTQTAKYENLQASALVHSVDLESLIKALAKAIEG